MVTEQPLPTASGEMPTVSPVSSLDDLTADTFESDEELEDFLAFIHAERRCDTA